MSLLNLKHGIRIKDIYLIRNAQRVCKLIIFIKHSITSVHTSAFNYYVRKSPFSQEGN